MSIATERPDELIEILKSELQEIIGWVIIQDQKSSGTQGGTFTSGAWRTRTLNTTVLNTIGADYSLAANQFTLPKGNYIIYGSATGYRVQGHAARLYNITDAAVVTTVEGSSVYSGTGHFTSNISKISGFFSISASKTFELQHRCQATFATEGLGKAVGFTVQAEMYAEVVICKIG